MARYLAKTKLMLDFEERIAAPTEEAIVAAINATNSIPLAAEKLGLPVETMRMWIWRLGIILAEQRLTASLPIGYAEVRQDRAEPVQAAS